MDYSEYFSIPLSPLYLLSENKVTKVRAAIYHHHENVHMSTSHFLSLEKVTKLWGAWFRIPHLSRIFQKLVRPAIEMMNCEGNSSSPGDSNPILIPEINKGSKCRSSFWIFIADVRLDSRLETGLAGPELDHVLEHRLVPGPPDAWGDLLRVRRGYGHTEAGRPVQIRVNQNKKHSRYAIIYTLKWIK